MAVFPLVSAPGGEGISVWKKSASRRRAKSLRSLKSFFRKVGAGAGRPILDGDLVSRGQVDDFGQPRVLSSLEVVLHRVARLAVIGTVIGFALAILLLARQTAPSAGPTRPNTTQVQAAREEEFA